jgi:hypothetical protein
VKSRTSAAFRKLLASLPSDVRGRARAAYRTFRSNPRHPSLHFKRLNTRSPIVAVRIGRDYRTVGIEREPGAILWFWIGPHEEYETLLSKRRR